jgi:UDP-N-acetylmuramate dehydrogenase
MNAGTRLGEMKDAVKAVRIVTVKGDLKDLPADSIRFQYRRAHLPKGLVVGVWLQLRHGIGADIARIVKDYLRYRKDTQPLAMPSAGCVFKNPVRDSAGRLLEAAGLKGMRIGDAEVSTKHGNFIVNRGHASAADVINLIQEVRRIIKQKAGVRLDLELKIVGEA